MEETEKRKERLRAMREEQHEAGFNQPASRLLLPTDFAQSFSESTAVSRPAFGFYSDPLAAYTGSTKRKSPSSLPFSSSSFHNTPQNPLARPSLPIPQQNFCPNLATLPSGNLAAGPTLNFPVRNPNLTTLPQQNFCPNPAAFPSFQPTGRLPVPMQFVGPNFPIGSPNMRLLPLPQASNWSGDGRGAASGPMRPWSSPNPEDTNSLPRNPNSIPVSSYPSLRPGGRGGNSSHERTHSGRGSNPGRRGTPYRNSGYNRGHRGAIGREHVGRGGRMQSASEQPEMFYRKSMVEDPWRDLTPKPLSTVR